VAIKNRKPYSYTSKNQIIAVKYEPYMRLIDGKILNIITGTLLSLVSLEKTRQKRATNFTRAIENLTLRKFGKKKLLPEEVIDILQNPEAEL